MIKKVVIILVFTLIVCTIAGCTSSTTNTATPDLSATLNAHFAKNYTLADNFTRVSEANEAPIYSGSFQDANGSLHSVVIYLANSTSEAQKKFEELKATNIDFSASLNGTVNTNTSTRWAITANDTSFNGWVVQPNTAGPFDLSLDTAYVLDDMTTLMITSETAAVVTTGGG
jgi:hypothetical protein